MALIVFLALLGAFSAWLILPWTDCGLFQNKPQLAIAIGVGGLWILLALAAANIGLGLWMTGGLLIAGVLFGWSGRRTELGKYVRSQVLGLRHYLSGKDKEQLRHACQGDPDYYFRMAPCAIALGVGKAFARAVGKEKLERCPYLLTGTDAGQTAAQWHTALENTVRAMDARSQKLWLEKLLRLINNLTRP